MEKEISYSDLFDELANVEVPVRRSKRLIEGKTFNLNDKEEVEEANKFIDKKEDTEKVQEVVDVDASVVDELADSYAGKMLLRCPACKTVIYKKPEELIKDPNADKAEDGKILYNVEEVCEHCGAKGGFILEGQVKELTPAEYDEEHKDDDKPLEDKKPEEDNKQEPEKEPENKPEDKPAEPKLEDDNKPADDENISIANLKKEKVFEDLNEKSFESCISKYLKKIDENFKSFKVNSASLDKENNKLIIEGVETLKENINRDITLTLDTLVETSTNKVICEGYIDDIKLSFEGDVAENSLVCESLTVETKKETEILTEHYRPAREKKNIVLTESFNDVKAKNLDYLVNRYLEAVYDNVNKYKTKNVSTVNNNLYVEGYIELKDSNKINTKFMFTPTGLNEDGTKIKFSGTNTDLTQSHSAYRLVGTLRDNSLICEALTYNYLINDKVAKGLVKHIEK